MNITTTIAGERADMAITGRFDAHETDNFRTRFDELVSNGAVRVWVDLSGVNFIDSSGLAELVRAMKRLRELTGDLAIESPSDPVAVILELTGLHKAFVLDVRS